MSTVITDRVINVVDGPRLTIDTVVEAMRRAFASMEGLIDRSLVRHLCDSIVVGQTLVVSEFQGTTSSGSVDVTFDYKAMNSGAYSRTAGFSVSAHSASFVADVYNRGSLTDPFLEAFERQLSLLQIAKATGIPVEDIDDVMSVISIPEGAVVPTLRAVALLTELFEGLTIPDAARLAKAAGVRTVEQAHALAESLRTETRVLPKAINQAEFQKLARGCGFKILAQKELVLNLDLMMLFPEYAQCMGSFCIEFNGTVLIVYQSNSNWCIEGKPDAFKRIQAAYDDLVERIAAIGNYLVPAMSKLDEKNAISIKVERAGNNGLKANMVEVDAKDTGTNTSKVGRNAMRVHAVEQVAKLAPVAVAVGASS